MAALFEDRRSATSDEITRLIASFGIPSMSEALSKAEISEIRTLDEFGSLPTGHQRRNAGDGSRSRAQRC